MKIKTEHDVGDKVFFVEKENVKHEPIRRIYIAVGDDGCITVEYRYLKQLKSGSLYTTIKNPKKTLEELAE